MAGLTEIPGIRNALAEMKQIPAKIAERVALRITKAWRATFAAGQDPYGNPWRPLLPSTLRRKGGDARILRRTDAMFDETRAKPLAGAGVALVAPDPARWHQSGTAHMAARPVAPAFGMPAPWRRIAEEEAEKAARGAWKGTKR